MKTLPALFVSSSIVVGSLVGGILFLDAVLPPEVFQTRAWAVPDHPDRVSFAIPLTAGEMASCQVGPEQARDLRPGTPIEVRRSLLLARCVGLRPLRTAADHE